MDRKRFVSSAIAIAEQMGFHVHLIPDKGTWVIDFENGKQVDEDVLGELFLAGIAKAELNDQEVNTILSDTGAQPCTHAGMRAIIAKMHARGLA